MAQSLSRAREYSYCCATACIYSAILRQLRREPEHTKAAAEMAIRLAQEHGFPYREAVARILRGWAEAVAGNSRAGIEELTASLAHCRATGAEMDDPYYLVLLAEASAAAGETRRALSALDEAAAAIRDGREFFFEPEIHRVRGVLLSGAGLDDGPVSLRRALETANRRGVRCSR